MTEMLSCCREFSLVMRSAVHQSRQVGLQPTQVSCLPPSSYPQNLKLPQIITPNTSGLQALKAKPTDGSSRIPKTKEQKWVHEGLITESLPNGMFWVRLDNDDMILGYVSGKIRQSKLRILPGDKVEIEVSRYDSTRGRITYRLRNKDPNS